MIFPAIMLLIFKNPQEVITQMLASSKQTVELVIELFGIYAVWLGILEIVEKSGLGGHLQRLLSPITKRLFKCTNEEANKYISINLASNILGLGNAATPSGIKAMQLLDDQSGKASFSAMMLIVINACSVQLIPTTIIGLRESAGSINSGAIILPILISSFSTCFFACGLMYLISRFKKGKAKK